jgi:hypothetical protein
LTGDYTGRSIKHNRSLFDFSPPIASSFRLRIGACFSLAQD